MTVEILNYLHRKGFRRQLAVICGLCYFVKGNGYVESRYIEKFRAYSFKVKGITYLSLGPGWAFSFDYLRNEIIKTYNYYYLPVPGDCVVDIGAGLGEESVIYSLLVGGMGKVHSLEANPITFAGLQFMCNQNNFTQTTPHHVAIYKNDGEVTIEDDAENYLTNTINSEGKGRPSIVVNAKTLDTLIMENNIDRIDFLKSNIEGAEQYLIEGMKNSINIIKNVCISCHDFRHVYHNHGEFYMTKNKVITFLKDHGFEVVIRNTGNRVVDDYIYGAKK